VIRLETSKSVALDSPDHVMPWGTKKDNSRNRRFNEKLYALFAGVPQLRVLDLGCSGGGFVRDCLNDGCLAVGLEGSDYSRRHQRGEWTTIDKFLLTCDITADFRLYSLDSANQEPLRFHVVTSWEVLEHIPESALGGLIENVKKHLVPGGLWIASICPTEDVVGGVRLHQTVKPKQWWLRMFAEAGLHHIEQHVDYFNTQFVRGPKYGTPRESFHVVLTNDLSAAPKPRKVSPQAWIYDRWLGSHMQKSLRRIMVGPTHD